MWPRDECQILPRGGQSLDTGARPGDSASPSQSLSPAVPQFPHQTWGGLVTGPLQDKGVKTRECLAQCLALRKCRNAPLSPSSRPNSGTFNSSWEVRMEERPRCRGHTARTGPGLGTHGLFFLY